MLRGESPIVYGTGEQSRDFTHIDNVIAANLGALKAAPEACGRVYNVACGASISLLDLIAAINDILGTEIQPEFRPARAGDVLHSLADISQTRANLGYGAEIQVYEGLKRTVSWYRDSLRDA